MDLPTVEFDESLQPLRDRRGSDWFAGKGNIASCPECIRAATVRERTNVLSSRAYDEQRSMIESTVA